LRFLFSQAGGAERKRLIELWGGTTTANRREWRRIIREGLRDGWYTIRFGQVVQVEQAAAGLLTIFQPLEAPQKVLSLQADFIIDATGLDAELESSPLLKDLLETYQLGKNTMGKLSVSDNFEVIGMQNGPGRLFASGAMTLGGPFAPVDSFIGLQYAAQLSLKTLIALGAPGLRPMSPLYSSRQWLRWARGVHP
jgi:hypothetical protein